MPFLPALALCAAALAPTVPAQDAVARARPLIERLAKSLGDDGLQDEARECLRALAALEADAARLAKTEAVVDKALSKAHGEPSKKDLEKRAGEAEAVAVWLVRAARDAGDEARKAELLELALAFDHANELAHEERGDVRGPDGVFRAPRLAACLERRSESARAMQRARGLAIEIEAIEPTDPTLLAICAEPSAVSHDGLVIQSVWPQERLETVFRDILRAMAWSNWIVRGELVPVHARGNVVHLVFQDEYDAFVDAAHGAGRLDDEEYERAKQLAGTQIEERTRNGYASIRTQVSQTSQGYFGTEILTIFDMALQPKLPGSQGPPQWMLAGHANYVGLAFLGTRMGRWASLEKPDDQRTATKRAGFELRLPNAGLVGCRTYLRALAIEGSAPSLASCLLPLSDVVGPLLLKSTSVVEMLHEEGSTPDFLTAYGRAAAKGGHPAALAEAGLGVRLPEFEERWTAWILGDDAAQSLAGRLRSRGGSGGSSGPELAPEAAAVLAKLNALRDDLGLGPVELVDELSRGAALHAAYLGKHPEQSVAWPDAHEEWPDVPEFTPAGAWAGGMSVIAFNGAKRCLDEWMGTFYHRVPLTHPGLVGIGFAEVDGICVLDCGSLVDPNATGWVAYPRDGQKDVPLHFVPELPNPVPEIEDQGTFGHPITLQLGSDWAGVDAELRLLDGDEPVEAWVSSPSEPTNPKLAPERTWCLIAKAPLKPKTVYTVEAKLGERTETWTFTTER